MSEGEEGGGEGREERGRGEVGGEMRGGEIRRRANPYTLQCKHE